ncbi:MAG: hypothetical protein E6J77_18195, partial [Deltaproteobacteria bacterium]
MTYGRMSRPTTGIGRPHSCTSCAGCGRSRLSSSAMGRPGRARSRPSPSSAAGSVSSCARQATATVCRTTSVPSDGTSRRAFRAESAGHCVPWARSSACPSCSRAPGDGGDGREARPPPRRGAYRRARGRRQLPSAVRRPCPRTAPRDALSERSRPGTACRGRGPRRARPARGRLAMAETAVRLALLLAALACACRAPDPRPDVVVIVLDAVRADHLSAYGYARPTTPVIDALANAGVLYRRAISAGTWTVPGHASLLTGRLPTSHGAYRAPGGTNAATALDASVETLAERLSAAGYDTAAFLANHAYLDPAFGLSRGFR